MKETKAQLEYIKYIEEETGIVYKGNTKQEASKYIDENKGKVPLLSRENTWAILNGY